MDIVPKPHVGGSCPARAARPLNASTARAQPAVTEPNRRQSPLRVRKEPPDLPSRVPASSPGGMAPDYWSHWLVDWFKCDRGIVKSATPKINETVFPHRQ
jgi:hypothetical protein